MSVDPKGDVDICITCLTKKPPKLPLREELNSLGVELIYKAQGVGAKTSKQMARRVAKDFTYNESFKDLQKRRFFPKSSKRIKGILEERKRREAELRNESSAVSYESYQSELYGGWVTDTSSSASNKSGTKSTASSKVSEVSAIHTTGNRRMTKTALKKWKLFRVKSQRKREISQEKKTKERSKVIQQDNKSRTTLDSLIGEEVFADFLTPLPAPDDGTDSDSSFDDIFPSWYPEKLKQRYKIVHTGNQQNQLSSNQNKGKQIASSNKDSAPDYFTGDDFPSVGWNDESTNADIPAENSSPSSYGRPAPSFLDSDQYEAYPEAKSPPPYKPHGSVAADAKTPPSDTFMSKFSKTFQLNGTPTTMATTPASTPAPHSLSSEESSNVSSISESDKPHAGQKTLSRKQPGHASIQQETQERIFINNFKNQDESASESSLIGLNVTFPREGQDVGHTETKAYRTLTHSPIPLQSEEDDVDISGTTESLEEKQGQVNQGAQEKAKEDQSGIFDNVLSYVFNSKSPRKEAVSSVDSPSDTVPLTPTTNPFDDESSKLVEIQEQVLENSGGAVEESPLKFLQELPEQFFKAFSNEPSPTTNDSASQSPGKEESATHEEANKEHCTEPNKIFSEPDKINKNDSELVVPEVVEGTLVFPLHDGIEKMNSFQPIVPGYDVKDYQNCEENGASAKILKIETSTSHRSTDSKEEVRKKKKSLKWWKGSFPKFRRFLKNKKISAPGGSAVSLGEELTHSSSAEISSPLSSQTEKRALRKQTASLKGYESGLNRYPIIEVIMGSEARNETSTGKNEKEQCAQVGIDKSTALAFSNIPDSFYSSLGQNGKIEGKNGKEMNSTEEIPFHHVVRETQLRLTQYDTDVEEISKIINEDLTIAYLKDPDDGQMLLHRFASSPFPLHVDSNDFLSLLMEDIRIFKEKLELIYVFFPAASEVVDGDGDLPVHSLARNLMEWETAWYAKLYGLASKETADGTPGGLATRAITTIYNAMSQCAETLLQRVVQRADLCRQRGSLGSLLPLHIATVFTSSVPILRQALEAYPSGAFEAASIKGFQSFVPNGALPLEIHDAVCTDFPKWEEEVSSGEGMKWSENHEDRSSSNADNRIRRSDLLFAYNPSITKFWKDKARIRRIERQINSEAKQADQAGRHDLSSASKRLWLWLCTFSEANGDHAVFAKSVSRIVGDLPMSQVRLLATISASNGEAILDIAHADCVRIIQARFDTVADTISPIVSTSQSSKIGSRILDSWDNSRNSNLPAANSINLGQVCRSIFNVQESDIPTSFVILPYRLIRNGNGVLQISPTESSAIAVKFAEFLMKLTDPRSVLYYLDRKSEEYFGISMYEGSEDASTRELAFKQIQLFEKQFLEMYRSAQAYLYLLDEDTGAPIISNSNDIYPIPVQHPVGMVKKLLPLMIAGMIQMRGEKGVSILATVLLDESISLVPAHYANSAEVLKRFLPKILSSSGHPVEESDYLQEELERFLSGINSQKVRQSRTLTSTTEWNVELSILRMFFEYNDPTRLFSGLKRGSAMDGNVVQWIFTGYNAGFHATSSQSTEGSQSESYSTLRSHPLKFPQPQQDDATESCDESQESKAVRNLSRVESGLASSLSEETTESQFISKRSMMLSDHFALKVSVPSRPQDHMKISSWNPAEQVWVDVRNRLEVTEHFWDEARVTNLRVALLEQANKLCQLQNRIQGIRQEENTHSSRVNELFCKIMEDDMNILEVPSLRTLFRIRHLLTRMNELEDKLMENEIDVQHLDLGVRLVHQEILDLLPSTLEYDMSSNQWSDSSDSSSSSSSFLAQRDTDGVPLDQVIMDAFTREALVRHPERIRRAFANARKRSAARGVEDRDTLSAPRSHVLLDTSTSGENDATKVSSLTTRSSTLRERVAAARSRAMVASQSAAPPSEIALPTLNHLILGRDTSGLGEHSSASSSSASFENTSIVKYHKTSGLIEF